MNRPWLRRLGRASTGLFLCTLFAVLPATPASATATGAASGTLHFEVVDVQDDMGNSIGMAPAGFSFSVSAFPVTQLPDGTNSGPGGVTFGGTAVASGMGQSSVIDFVNDGLSCTANPGGSFSATQDTFGVIEVSNTSGQTIVLVLQFDTSSQVSASTTLAGETAGGAIDGDYTIPVGTTLAAVSCPGATISSTRVQFEAPFVNGPGAVTNPLSTCTLALTVPTGIMSTGSAAAMLASCSASSPAVVPSAPPSGLAALALLLLVAGWFFLRRERLAG